MPPTAGLLLTQQPLHSGSLAVPLTALSLLSSVLSPPERQVPLGGWGLPGFRLSFLSSMRLFGKFQSLKHCVNGLITEGRGIRGSL